MGYLSCTIPFTEQIMSCFPHYRCEETIDYHLQRPHNHTDRSHETLDKKLESSPLGSKGSRLGKKRWASIPICGFKNRSIQNKVKSVINPQMISCSSEMTLVVKIYTLLVMIVSGLSFNLEDTLDGTVTLSSIELRP